MDEQDDGVRQNRKGPRSPSDVLITMPELEVLTTYCKVHIYQMIRDGRFPKQLRLGPNKVAWLRSEVLAWIEEKAAEREAA